MGITSNVCEAYHDDLICTYLDDVLVYRDCT